jgi:hypothetical protein
MYTFTFLDWLSRRDSFSLTFHFVFEYLKGSFLHHNRGSGREIGFIRFMAESTTICRVRHHFLGLFNLLFCYIYKVQDLRITPMDWLP